MIVLGVLPGIVIAIALAVLLFFRRSWQPHGAVLGQVEDLAGWHSVERYPDARQLPGIVGLPLGGSAVLRELLGLPDPDPPRRR